MKIVCTYGAATPRYTTSLCVSENLPEHQVEVPIGSCIARWHVRTKKRLALLQVHSDVLTFMAPNPMDTNIIATMAYCGELRLWNERWEPISQMFDVGNEKLAHAMWSPNGRFIVLCSEGGEGLLTIVRVEKCDDNVFTLTKVSELKGYYEFACFDRHMKHVLAVWQRRRIKGHDSKAVLFSLDEKCHNLINLTEINSIALKKDDSQVIAVQCDEKYERIALAFQDKMIIILEIDILQEVIKFKPESASHIKCMVYEDSSLIIRTSHGFGQWVISDGEAKLVNRYNVPSVLGNVFYVGYAKYKSHGIRNDRSLWVATDSHLYLIDLDNLSSNEEMISIGYHSLTCCGIDFSIDGKYLASGDFIGNVMLWATFANDHDPVLQCNVGLSVRSISCRTIPCSNQLHVYIGTLDGSVYRWQIDTEKMICREIEKMLSMSYTITTMKWQHGQDSQLMALGTSDGMLCIIEPGEDVIKIKLGIVAHKPIKENTDNRFGSIAKYSEVWSLAWSPCNQFVATCSEDQTTCIWNMYGEKMHMLTGHTTAVTSVEWRFVPDIGELMVTCADDRTVMLWKLNVQTPKYLLHIQSHLAQSIEKPDEEVMMESKIHITDNKNKWGLYHVFKTDSYGLDWHTITYLALDKRGGSKLACATQNGYIFVWDMITKELLDRKKMHNGSIEGLTWSHGGNNVASVSSDCTVNVYEM